MFYVADDEHSVPGFVFPFLLFPDITVYHLALFLCLNCITLIQKIQGLCWFDTLAVCSLNRCVGLIRWRYVVKPPRL